MKAASQPPTLLQQQQYLVNANNGSAYTTTPPALAHQPTHPRPTTSTAPLSPRPQRPQGGAVDTATAAKLEKQASITANQLLGGSQKVNTMSRTGPAIGQPGPTTTTANPRIANWVATSASNNGPGFAAYVNSARGNTPAPPQSNNSASMSPRIAHPGTYNSSAAYSTSMPNSSGLGNTPTLPNNSRQQSQYDNMNARTLHQSFSDIDLNGRGATSQAPAPRSRPPVQTYAASPANMNPAQYRISSPINGPSGNPNYTSTPRTSSNSQIPMSTSNSNSRLSSLVPAATQQGPSQYPSDHPSWNQQANPPLASSSVPQPVSSNIDPTMAPPTLCIALPSQSELAQQRDQTNYSADPAQAKVTWAKNVMKFVERFQASASVNASGETSKITDPLLVKWTDEAIRIILQCAETQPNPVPEALYLRGELSNSGKFPSYRLKDLSLAFRDFELSANLGFNPAWAKIALAYENFGEANNSQTDYDRAKRAYEEGVGRNEVTCTYRIAMAHLLGQLGFKPNASVAIPLLRQAASLSTVDDPLPSYIYGMLLAGELDLGPNINASINPSLLLNEKTGQPQDPKPWIERSAYLGYAPAQFKMGFNYEYASMGCGYDPLLSVQYYSLASQQGDIEADMALSKWFLCGSEAFDLQENLAFTFAEKAARKGLPSAEFALGYYFEIGIGGRKDVEASKRWYSKAAAHGNKDAQDRLQALNVNSSNVLTRGQHESQINDKIVRRHTQARDDANRRRTSSLAQQQPLPPLPPLPQSMPSPPQQQASLSQSVNRLPPRASSSNLYASQNQPNARPGSAAPVAAYNNYHNPNVAMPDIIPTDSGNTSLRRRETLKLVQQAASGQFENYANDGRRTSSSSVSSAYPAQQQSARNSFGQSTSGRPRGDSLNVPSPSQVQRYSLVDNGPSTGSSGASAVSMNSVASGLSVVNDPKPAVGPQTFEAMGLKTGKVKAEQECIIC